jgi:BlaI family transcriptional regulator, penicillinase repressor
VTRVDALFTQRELDVMGVLWDDGSGTVAEVKEKMAQRLKVELAYTTVLTILRTLETKGFVSHEVEGRAHRYLPLVTREDAQRSHVDRMVRKLFKGKAGLLIQRTLESQSVPAAERSEIRKTLG